jgi:diketogulonate reductase-like aldo/keto reductase
MTVAPLIHANGADIPALGLGTFRLRGDDCRTAVQRAIDLGYRHIDTAAMYENEIDVGAGVRAAHVGREQVFVTTKVWTEHIAQDALLLSAEASLQRLRFDYVDLLLIHWPNRNVPLAQSIDALCEAKRRGYTKHIGVANFPVALLQEAVRLCAERGERLATNQCEYHPRLDQSKVLAACAHHGIAFVSYCPLGQGNMVHDPVIVRIAQKHKRTPAQIILRWHVQQPHISAIPKSGTPAHIKSNFEIFDFTLPDDDMSDLSALRTAGARLVNPAFAPDWDR